MQHISVVQPILRANSCNLVTHSETGNHVILYFHKETMESKCGSILKATQGYLILSGSVRPSCCFSKTQGNGIQSLLGDVPYIWYTCSQLLEVHGHINGTRLWSPSAECLGNSEKPFIWLPSHIFLRLCSWYLFHFSHSSSITYVL